MGFSDATYAVVTGKQWFRVPETVKFILNGKLPPRVMSKDALLYIAGKYTAEVAQYKAVEFVGGGATDMSLASRMTMSNMGVEIGAKFAFFEADEKTLEMGPFGSTMMACPGDVMDLERLYLQELEKVGRYRLTSAGDLELLNESGDPVLVFVRSEP